MYTGHCRHRSLFVNSITIQVSGEKPDARNEETYLAKSARQICRMEGLCIYAKSNTKLYQNRHVVYIRK